MSALGYRAAEPVGVRVAPPRRIAQLVQSLAEDRGAAIEALASWALLQPEDFERYYGPVARSAPAATATKENP